MEGNDKIKSDTEQTLAQQRRLQLMADFEIDGMNTGAINQSDCHRNTEDDTKWTVRHVGTLYQLWLAGRRAGRQELIDEGRT